ncbi:Com family DNA-binding transcriptional regulator [Arsenophonus sp. PmNCSU2021_1]|uniref:Com family DNA-binding transcriptional regulator n=1 Tax=Arsenophonus sp. PmNCSU2021_1 TaxID=3118989 RepID=UPI003FA5A89C
MLQEIRCCGCHRLLAKANAIYIQIKCPRCKAFNEMRMSSPSPSVSERQTETSNEAHQYVPYPHATQTDFR